jgi:hypothetical protein
VNVHVVIASVCYIVGSPEMLRASYKISAVFFGSFFALNLHFNIVFTRHRPGHRLTALVYLPVPVVIITTLIDYSFFSDFVPANRSFGLYFYLLHGLVYMATSIILLELYRRRTALNKDKWSYPVFFCRIQRHFK